MSQADNHTFPVIADHPAYAVRYCPMCGGCVDEDMATNQPIRETNEKASALLDYLYHLSSIHSTAPAILISKLIEPTATMRHIAKRIKLSKSAISKVTDAMADYDGRLGRIVHGTSYRRSKAQSGRRKRERGVYYGPE